MPEPFEIARLTPADRGEWEQLARGYKAFYQDPVADSVYDALWGRLIAGEAVSGLAARSDGAMVGITHFLFHAHSWKGEICYLQDLFTVPEARGKGVARRLIDAVAEAARSRGAAGLYWQTKQDNLVARALYDKVARHKGFIRYDYPL